MSITFLLAMTMAAGLSTEASAAVAQAQITRSAPATPAAATAQTDARFAHWLGCWRLEDDLVGTGARVCITPDDKQGVKLQTLVGTQRGLDEVIVPDGVARPISDPECKGTERSEWSNDGLRVFRVTDVMCGKDPARKVSSVTFLTKGPAWVNVQLVEGGPTKSVRVQRYRRALDQNLADGSRAPMPSARMLAEAPPATATDWNVNDVIEASAKLPADAVQAAISEDSGSYDLNRRNLVAMDDAGVPEPVIDLMVALTYPKRFVVQRAGAGSYAPSGISMGGGWYDPFMSPLAFSSMSDCYSPYSGYRSYYSPCGSFYAPYGYGYNSYYNNNYGNFYPGYSTYGGGWVALDPNAVSATPSTEGRVVNGRGYTQVRPREAEPSPIRSGNVGNGAAHDNGGGSSSSGGGTSGASSQGYSSGSSGGSSSSGSDSGARTAVPRPPGQ
ncbi:MAG: hypothetical protein Q7R30_24555 [Acidobacteriota bacterium]|nr:hypothetical protein [Acidobacteriota bacterium]